MKVKVFIDENNNILDTIIGYQPNHNYYFDIFKTKSDGILLAHCNFKHINLLNKVVTYDNYFIDIDCTNRAFRKRTYLIKNVENSSKEGIFILSCSIYVDINNNTKRNDLFEEYASNSNIFLLDSLVNPNKIRLRKLIKI